jgi:hypothetical protein
VSACSDEMSGEITSKEKNKNNSFLLATAGIETTKKGNKKILLFYYCDFKQKVTSFIS